MTHQVSRETNHLLHADGTTTEHSAETCPGLSMARLFLMLTDGAEVDDVLRAFPGLTRDDLRALLTDAVTRDDAPVSDGSTTFISPQDFYHEAVQREDIRRILAALAK